MATWNNLDTLASYKKLAGLKNHVDIKEAMSGENGATRVAKYSAPMAEGLSFNYAAKQVDDTVLAALAELAEESQLADKFEELYNGAVINTGEKRLVLHHLARRQLGKDVVVDGVNNVISMFPSSRKPQILLIKCMLVTLLTLLAKSSQLLFRLVSAEVT